MATTFQRAELRDYVHRLGGVAEAARVLGVSDVAVHYWISGARRISPEHAAKLRDAALRVVVSRVTAAELLLRVVRLGSVAAVARAVGCSVPLLRRYLREEYPIPQRVVDALDRLLAEDVH